MKKVTIMLLAVFAIASFGFAQVALTEDWSQLSSVYGGGDDGNDMRDVAYNAATGHILITDTDLDRIHIINASDGTYTGNDLTTTCSATSYVAWLGPYGITASSDGAVYLSAYVTGFGVGYFASETTLVCDKASTTTNNSRGLKGLDGVAAVNQILYVAGNAAGHPVDIMSTTDGATFTTIESPVFGADSRYGVGPKSTNTGGDGDTVYACGSVGAPTAKFDRTGGSWVADAGFVTTQIASKCEVVNEPVVGDIVFAAVFSGGADEDGIWVFDGATGAVVGIYDFDAAYGAQTNSGNNAGLDVDPVNKKVYFTADEFSTYGRLSYVTATAEVKAWSLF